MTRKYTVISWSDRERAHSCKDEYGQSLYVDFYVDGPVLGLDPENPHDLVGRTIYAEGSHPYVEIAYGITLGED